MTIEKETTFSSEKQNFCSVELFEMTSEGTTYLVFMGLQ